ncbi:MAG TPA: proline racemase family protein [Planctomycetaceae bacterium]|nr:proline racemase family protein [Planctomycetaceae bacterium]
MPQISVIDTHTGGEPTRVVDAGGPDLGTGSLAERRERFRTAFDHYRSAIINEPRGSDVTVGALLVPPTDPSCRAGVIFFNNVGYLGMCGHGTIGVAVALGHLNRIVAGSFRLETPVGIIDVRFDGDNRVTLDNVPSWREQTRVAVDVPDYGRVTGDVAYGGNWFFLVSDHGQILDVKRTEELTAFATRIRGALVRDGITGRDGAEIDHVELFGPPSDPQNHSRNFVLCPGLAYDRSPCGTGTSAKIACLAADGKLAPGDVWRQESIVGSVFEASYRRDGDAIIPSITGTAYVNATATLILDDNDPFQWGIRR